MLMKTTGLKQKVKNMIPYGCQEINEEDIQCVVDVLRSSHLTQGPAIPAFEKSITEYCNVGYAVAVNSATSALHLACIALGVRPGDWVWTTPVSFVASANCALYCGAKVDFVDIDRDTYNISVECLKEKLAYAEKNGRLPKVVIPVHLSGQACDMLEIHLLSRRYGFKIIEDASHAIGGKYRGEPVGNCRYSDITVFSFHPVKIITTGEGGMALTNDERYAHRMRKLRSHGITRNSEEMTHEPDGPWYYQQTDLGFNYRMTDIQAALGVSQMRRLDEFVLQRHVIAENYDEQLIDFPLILPRQHEDCYSSMHLYVIRLRLRDISKTQDEVFQYMLSESIGVNLHYIPIYLQPYYQEMGFNRGYCEEAERYYSEAMSLPIYPRLNVLQQEKVVKTLLRAVAK